jgi:DNA-binding PadR family transcriptional regulator
MTHGSYAPSPGVVYPTLTMLEDMGLIVPASAEGSRMAYSVTSEGEAYLE